MARQSGYVTENKTHEAALRTYHDLQRDYWVAHAHRSTSGHALAESLSHALDRLHRADCPPSDIADAATHALREAIDAGARERWPVGALAADQFGLHSATRGTSRLGQAAALHNAIWDVRAALDVLTANDPRWAATMLRDSELATLEDARERLRDWVASITQPRG